MDDFNIHGNSSKKAVDGGGSTSDGVGDTQPKFSSKSTSVGNVSKNRAFDREKVISDHENPLSEKYSKSVVDEEANDYINRSAPKLVKKENLSIRREDEIRVVRSLHKASKKQATGSIYSVIVDLSSTGSLGIGVKNLGDNVLAVSLLKRENNILGAGERAGIRLGDVIFGVNFIPTREGSRTLINVIKKETHSGKTHIHIQGWRCHQLCSDAIPGYQFPRADDVIIQAYTLFYNKVFSDWERWNFIEILLGHMIEELKYRTESENVEESTKDVTMNSRARAKQMKVLDLERNILQAKGLRIALCVRIVHTKSHEDTVIYVLRIEDVEIGLQWVVQRRYSDFYSLYEELIDLSHFAKEVEFPRKRISLRNTPKLIESRIVSLEQYLRKTLHVLTAYATMDAKASRAMRCLQKFLGVEKYIDTMHPPSTDDQRFVELMAYRFLNDQASPACKQCTRFITTVNLEGMLTQDVEGYRNVLHFMRAALAEVELFVQQNHGEQIYNALSKRRPELPQERIVSFVRRCIRRQVEAALYLPLRRIIFRIVYSYLAVRAKRMHRCITLLQRASPNFLQVDPYVPRAKSLGKTIKAFRRVIQAYLPSDQGQLLIVAAKSVMELHIECKQEKDRLNALFRAEQRDTHHIIKSSAALEQERDQGDTVEKDVDNSLSSRGRRQTLFSDEDKESTELLLLKSQQLEWSLKQQEKLRQANYLSRIEAKKSANELEARRFPVLHAVKEIFGRKKTKDDLFSSSDEETNGNSEPEHEGAVAKNMNGFTPCVGSSASEDFDFSVEKPISSGTDDDSKVITRNFARMGQLLRPLKGVTTATFSAGMDNSSGIETIINYNHYRNDAFIDGKSAFTVSLTNSSDVHTEENEPRHSEVIECENWKFDQDLQNEEAASAEMQDLNTTSTVESRISFPQKLVNTARTGSIDSSANQELSVKSAQPVEKAAVPGDGRIDDPLYSPIAETLKTPATIICNAPMPVKFQTKLSDSDADAVSDSMNTDGNAITGIQDGVNESSSLHDTDRPSLHTEVDAIGADDFLPLFTYALVQAGLPQLLQVKELMVALVNDEDSYGECGYYLATLEASTEHISNLAAEYEHIAQLNNLEDVDGEHGFEYFDDRILS